MDRRLLIAFLTVSFFVSPLLASDTTQEEDIDIDQPPPALESEAKGIIPEGGLTVSTQPITPIATLPEHNPYDQALQELAIAQGLLQKGRMEAASDVSLQAYDDLRAVYVPRRNKNKKKRKKLRADRHQAATVYITSSLAYIEDYVKEAGGGARAIEEGRARAADLRDVSANYPELNVKVTQALERFTVAPSTTVVPSTMVVPSSPTTQGNTAR
jgi:hypothetical protein